MTARSDHVYGGIHDKIAWTLYGTILVDGQERSIWMLEDDGEKAVYQMTRGEEPANRSGYYNLETLVGLKGVSIHDIVPADCAVAVQPGPRP